MNKRDSLTHFTYKKENPGTFFFLVPASWSSFHSVHSLLPTMTEVSDSVVPSRRPGFMLMLKSYNFDRRVDHSGYVLS